MNVIGGSAKRRKIKSVPFSLGVRPILARIKKSLFDILAPRLAGSDFLDLYAGSGAVGIEAISRGARHVVFVERNPVCVSAIRQNLSRFQFFDKARVVKADATRNLSLLGKSFDLIFMGPPYHDERWNALILTEPTLQNIAASGILKPGGWVIGQHHAKEPSVKDARWNLFRDEHYGDSRLSFIEYVG
jgi:16S rRNA (guanine966-N2)-methyltransferase